MVPVRRERVCLLPQLIVVRPTYLTPPRSIMIVSARDILLSGRRFFFSTPVPATPPPAWCLWASATSGNYGDYQFLFSPSAVRRCVLHHVQCMSELVPNGLYGDSPNSRFCAAPESLQRPPPRPAHMSVALKRGIQQNNGSLFLFVSRRRKQPSSRRM